MARQGKKVKILANMLGVFKICLSHLMMKYSRPYFALIRINVKKYKYNNRNKNNNRNNNKNNNKNNNRNNNRNKKNKNKHNRKNIRNKINMNRNNNRVTKFNNKRHMIFKSNKLIRILIMYKIRKRKNKINNNSKIYPRMYLKG